VLGLALLLLAPAATAQNVSFTKTKDNPEDAIVDFYLGLDPLWMELGGQNLLSMGWGAYAFYNMNQRIMFEADIKLPYHRRWVDAEYLSVDEKGKWEKEDYFNDYKPAKLTQLTLTAHYTLVDWTKSNKRMKAHVKTEYHGDYKVESFLPFRGSKKTMIQARGGLFYNRSVVHRDVPIPEGFDTESVDAEGNSRTAEPYSNMAYTALFAGFNTSKIWEAAVDIDGYGSRTTRAHNIFYIDAFFAPGIVLRDLKQDELQYDLVENGHFKKQNLGWRVGWASLPDYKNFMWGTEFGNRPGIYKLDELGEKADVNRGVYWNFWMIFSLYNKY
jgi:hypothetical protein